MADTKISDMVLAAPLQLSDQVVVERGAAPPNLRASIAQIIAFAAGGGDVEGPAGATDSAIAVYDGATGKVIKNTSVTIGANGEIISADPAAKFALRGEETDIVISGVTFDLAGVIHNEDATTLNLGLHSHNDSGAFVGSVLEYARSRGTEGAETIVADNDILGRHDYLGHDGTDYVQAAEARVVIDGTPGPNNMPAEYVIATNPGGAAAIDRLWVKPDGHIEAGSGQVSLTDTVGNILLAALDPTGGVQDDIVFFDSGAWARGTITDVQVDLTTDVTGILPDANVADDLTIDGGTINDTPIGAITPSTGDFTTVDATGNIVAVGGIQGSGVVVAHDVIASIHIKDTDAVANEGFWQINSTGESLNIGALDDLLSPGDTLLSAGRSGTSITSVTLGGDDWDFPAIIVQGAFTTLGGEFASSTKRNVVTPGSNVITITDADKYLEMDDSTTALIDEIASSSTHGQCIYMTAKLLDTPIVQDAQLPATTGEVFINIGSSPVNLTYGRYNKWRYDAHLAAGAAWVQEY